MDEQSPARHEPAINAPWPAVALVVALVAAYGLQKMVGAESAIQAYGFAPGDLADGRWTTLFTSLFLHGNWLHVGMNAIWALALAPPVARFLGGGPAGAVGLWLLFLASGAIGDIGFAALHRDQAGVMLVGASGGVAGLMGAASRLIGRRHGLAPLRDRRVASMGASWLGINLLLALLGGTALLEGAIIGWEAHIAGYVAGLLMIGPAGRLCGWADYRLARFRLAPRSFLEDLDSPRTDDRSQSMLVSQILKTKGDVVFTCAPDDTLAVAADLLHTRQVGAMVVVAPDGSVAGILSERDIVRQVARAGAGALEQPISDCMTRDVQFAQPAETVDSLLGRMTDRRIRHLPVVKDGRLVGIVSIGDLVKWKIAETEATAEDLKAYISHS